LIFYRKPAQSFDIGALKTSTFKCWRRSRKLWY